jgi:hypothetical protein
MRVLCNSSIEIASHTNIISVLEETIVMKNKMEINKTDMEKHRAKC